MRLAREAPDADVVCLNAGIWQHGRPVGGTTRGVAALARREPAGRRPRSARLRAPSHRPPRTRPSAHHRVARRPPNLSRCGAYAATKHALIAVAEQTALALRETSVTVTLLCPALVRSGMSPDGADPVDVAAEALRAARQGLFLVYPEEWASAIRSRTAQLLSGNPIEPPAFPS